MPTYAYRCADCGHAFDIQQSFSDDALSVCPECGGTLRKVFSSVGVVFKGSGFYRNDSRPGSKGASTPAKEPSATKDGGATTGAAASESGSSSTSTAPSTTTSPGSSSGSSGSSGSSSGGAKAASA